MEKPLVSVVIPVYNVEAYLRECVDSVLCQTYPHFEIILVDDGSTDSSGAICDEYAVADSRVRVVHKANGGASSARNVGIPLATGTYVYMPDSDDIISSDTLEKLVQLSEQEQADIAFFDATSFCDNGDSVAQRYIRRHTYPTSSGRDTLCRLLRNREFHVSIPLLLLKRTFLTRIDLPLDEGIALEDMIYALKLYLLADRVAYLPEALYQRRYRSGSVMSTPNWTFKFHCACIVYEKVRDFLLTSDYMQDAELEGYLQARVLNTIEYYGKMSRKDRREHKNRYKQIIYDVKANGYYNGTDVKLRCYGILPWFVYKCYEKTLGRVFGQHRKKGGSKA